MESRSRHNPDLQYQVKETNGEVKTYFLSHPWGNRKLRRSRQQHHPRFTKPCHKGRDWFERSE